MQGATDRNRSRPRVLAIANQKGGVGKTTTAINLGTALAAVGEQVLIVDLDPQGNASTGLGMSRQARAAVDLSRADRRSRRSQSMHRRIGHTAARIARHRRWICSAPNSSWPISSRKTYRLRDACIAGGSETLGHAYSYMLIDCPPSLNLLTINALSAADAVLVPLQCEFFALEGLSQLLKTVERVRANLNPRLTIQGVVLTMFDRRNSLSEQVAQDVRSVLGEKVYETVIPRNVRVSEAPSHGKPVLLYDRRLHRAPRPISGWPPK